MIHLHPNSHAHFLHLDVAGAASHIFTLTFFLEKEAHHINRRKKVRKRNRKQEGIDELRRESDGLIGRLTRGEKVTGTLRTAGDRFTGEARGRGRGTTSGR
jgi:hypothetical protein